MDPLNILPYKARYDSVVTVPILDGIVPVIALFMRSTFFTSIPVHVTPVQDGLPHTLVLGTPPAHLHPTKPVVVPRLEEAAKSHMNASALLTENGAEVGTFVGNLVGVPVG